MNLFTSLMRTVVPVVAGLLLTLAARVGLDLDGETVTAAVAAALTTAYYAAFRVLEDSADRLGWEPLRRVAGVLLGWARPPEYGQDPEVPGTMTVRLRAEGFEADLRDAVRRNIYLGDEGRSRP